jgi:hypothetical protein
MRAPWPVYVLEFLVLVGAVALVGFGFGWGVAAGLLALFTVSVVVGLLAARFFAKPS